MWRTVGFRFGLEWGKQGPANPKISASRGILTNNSRNEDGLLGEVPVFMPQLCQGPVSVPWFKGYYLSLLLMVVDGLAQLTVQDLGNSKEMWAGKIPEGGFKNPNSPYLFREYWTKTLPTVPLGKFLFAKNLKISVCSTHCYVFNSISTFRIKIQTTNIYSIPFTI